MFHGRQTEKDQQRPAQAEIAQDNTMMQGGGNEESTSETSPVASSAAPQAPQQRDPEVAVSPIQTPSSSVAPAQASPAMARPAAPRAPSYPAAPSPYGGVVSSAPSSADRRLTIGAGITMSGEIESCDTLVVEGTVEAVLKGASILQISESGAFFGTVEIEEATIAGRFEGDITVNGRLLITSTGSITGSVTYKELIVESGAALDGRVMPIGSESQAAATPGKPKARAAAKNDNRGRANGDASSDTELPFATAGETGAA